MVTRGAVCWVELDKRRPCVVVSSEDVLRADVWQTHVVPLTSNLDRAGLAGNVALNAAVTGLPSDSVAVPLGLELVDRSWLAETVGQLPAAVIDAVDDGVRAVLNL
ncbi:MAG: type II toxin-antitoxin system PemK/MazF family toxin [Acidimicrobiaceae bacterium]|nr:type II toxin-antitoxin system PemK/MazF family toxin [Acidimicrobiia bacterium]MCY4492234.1 type II toxin-antitoxin system PemK/MazF family toxin [Acidimicrobiaceae bacterium]